MNPRLKVLLGTLLLDVSACARPAQDTREEGRVDTQSSPAAQRDSQATAAPTPPAQAPKIDRVVPDSARVSTAVDEVRIIGSGFEPGSSGQNTVDIGPMIHLTMVPANDAGTEIRITVPKETQGTMQTRPRPVMPGTFDVTVTTRAGVSNAIQLRILP
jgi:hypothetical protein